MKPFKSKRNTAPVSIISEEELKDFRQSMEDTAQSFLQLRDRFMDVVQATQQYKMLQNRLNSPQLPKAELKTLQDKVADLSHTLESKLFKSQDMQSVLWQIFRFGGLGLLLGWFLRGWLG